MNITRNAAILAVAGAAALFASVPLALAQSPTRSPEEIDQLVGPIALYPDPLVSVVLPAATMPNDVQQAAQVVASGGVAAIDNQSWDDSVRAVAHYPDLVQWMSDNIDWTAQLGATFAAQPADVLNSIQTLRARARAVGTLVDTPQQRVVIEGNLIAIVPAERSVIYVPHYDAAVVYTNNPPQRGAAVFSFSAGFALGAWLTYDFDWQHHSLDVADRTWAEHRDWSRPSFSVAVNARENRREWRPAANRPQPNVNPSRTVVTPHAMGERLAGNEQRQADFRGDRNGTAIQPPANRTENRTQDRLSLNQAAQSRQPVQNPERPIVSTPPASAQPTMPPAPRVQEPSSQAGALSANEPRRVETQRSTNEPVRREPPRGSITAGSTGEYPEPAVTEKTEPSPKPSSPGEPNRNLTPARLGDDRTQRPENRPAMTPPSATPKQPQSVPPAQVKTPASTQNVPLHVQPKAETEEKKAKRQKDEEEKKKEKPENPSGG